MPIVQLVQLIQALAGFATAVPSMVTAAETGIRLLKEGRGPTPEEQAQLDQALADAEANIPQA